jgi:hypothetical protein
MTNVFGSGTLLSVNTRGHFKSEARFLLTGNRPPFLQFGQNFCENVLVIFFLRKETHKSGTVGT